MEIRLPLVKILISPPFNALAMTSITDRFYKVVVFIPPDTKDDIMKAVNDSMSPIYPNYDMVFSYQKVMGCWRPLEGADPHIGSIGQVEEAEELRLEFAIRVEDLRKVVDAIIETHPYEEPGIDIYPFIPGREVAGL